MSGCVLVGGIAKRGRENHAVEWIGFAGCRMEVAEMLQVLFFLLTEEHVCEGTEESEQKRSRGGAR